MGDERLTVGALGVLFVMYVGLVTGTLAGFFGVGGGFLLTPTLNILGFPMVTAIGTSFAAIAGNSTVGVLRHRRLGNVDVKLGLLLGTICVAGVEIGRRLVLALDRAGLSGTYVRVGYIGLLGALSLSMLKGFLRSPGGGSQGAQEASGVRFFGLPPMVSFTASGISPVSIWVIVLSGLSIGFISGFMGVGGGFIAFPLLIYIIGVPTRTAVGTSLFVTLFSSFYGVATYGLAGKVQWLMALAVLGGAVLGVQLGVRATRCVKPSRIRVLFALLLSLVTISVLLRQLRYPCLSLYLLLLFTSFLALAIWSLLFIKLAKSEK